MRRKDREVTDRTEILEMMRRCEVCNVAFVDEDAPYVVPINFGIQMQEDEVTLCFHCAVEGKKLELLARNPRVAFAMSTGYRLEWQDAGECTMRYESVCGKGNICIAQEDEKLDALKCIVAHYRPESAENKAVQYPDQAVQRTVLLKLVVSEYTAKRSGPKA